MEGFEKRGVTLCGSGIRHSFGKQPGEGTACARVGGGARVTWRVTSMADLSWAGMVSGAGQVPGAEWA